MEANEAQELQEHAEHGSHESALRPVAFTMSVLAVLVAVTTVLGHRTHTEAVLDQNKATDQWNFYQAHKIRANETELAADLMGVVTLADKNAAGKMEQAYADHEKKWADELKEEQDEGCRRRKPRWSRLRRAPTASTWPRRCWRSAWSSPRSRCLRAAASTGIWGLVFSVLGVASVVSAFFLK